MYAVITNSTLGKSIRLDNIIDEGHSYGIYNGYYYTYKLRFYATEEYNSIPNIYSKFNFPIDKIEIHESRENDTGEIEDIVVRTIEDAHTVMNIRIYIDTEVVRQYRQYGDKFDSNKTLIVDITFGE